MVQTAVQEQPGQSRTDQNGAPRVVEPKAPPVPTPEAPVAIELQGVGKCYQIYAHPADRLKQALTRWRKQYYREFWALRDVSFTVRRGESVGILGRNGSGKSTLVQMIAGTLSTTTGTLRAHGNISALLELGAGFNHEFTGRENIYLAGSVRGLSRRQINALFDDIVEFADIGDFLDQPVKTYSSGMYMRLAFAVAVQVRPDILVVDEALSVGDVFFKQRCHNYMREEMAGATKLLVTHDMNAVANHCDRAIVLSRGEMVFDGTPLDAIAYYTKILHKERFGAQGPGKTFRGANTSDESPKSKAAAGSQVPEGEADDSLPWVDVGEDDQGGAGEVVIRRVAITDADGEPIQAIKPEDPYACYFDLEVTTPKSNLLFGVTINDRFGKAVCGDNSLSLRKGSFDCSTPGRYLVCVQFEWPELQPGDYTATFGVGEGKHAHHHTVQCWAHNVVALSAIAPRRPVHGLFTNPMKDVRITRVG